jgi:5-(carboxyamino)imidazole ribonucleotide mutase
MKMKFLVAIIMGSKSDLPVMKDASSMLNSFNVSYEMKIISAHRTTEEMMAAKKRGIKVIIAGAGGAAHLPGMVASITTIPVIGVPIKTSGLDGLDSLMSIVQMPAGVPVATVAINGAKNAAILACQILALKYQKIALRIEANRRVMKKNVIHDAKELKMSSS